MVKFVVGLSSQFQALASKDSDTLYFITDTKKIYKGDVVVAECNVAFTTTAPTSDNTETGVLYVYTSGEGKTSLWINSGSEVVQVGGGEATEIADGVITISKFNSDTIATSVNLDASAASDAKLVTEKAVSTAIATSLADYSGVIVDVAAARAEDNSGTVLTFTDKSGTTKEVTVSDLFLTSASYNSETHILSFTVKGVADPVTVDMSTLVGNSLSDVIVGEDEAFTVELGSGGTVGGFKTGDTISKDTSLETIIKKLLMKQVPPTYTAPSVSIANNGGTASGNHEIGTTITPKLRGSFTKNDAGAITSITIKKGSTEVGSAGTTSPHDVTDTAFVLSATTSYSCTVDYAEGSIKNDNLGQPYPTGHIAAGSKTSSNYTFTPYRQGYFMGSSTSTEAPTSATIRGLASKKNGAYSKGTFKFTVPVGAAQVIIACPATSTGMTKVLNESALNADVTSTFTKSTVDVEGANGYTAVAYNVWTFTPPEVYGQSATLAVTLG